MTKDQAIYAAKERKPVVCNGRKYKRISAIIWRYVGGSDVQQMAHNVPKEMMMLELESIHGNSRTVVNPSACELAEY